MMPDALTVVGIAECAVSADAQAVLATYALGSCIAVAVWDPVVRVGGLLHFMLPESSLDTVRGRANPYLYADTGLTAMLRKCSSLGARADRMVTRAAGGASVLNDNFAFQIGNRNYEGLEQALNAAGLVLHAAALGGRISRSVRLEVGTGRLWVRTGAGPGRELELPGPPVQRKPPCR